MTFLDLIGSAMACSPCLPSFSIRLATIASRSIGCLCRRGMVTARVDMLLSDRRDCPEKDQRIASTGKSPKASLAEFSAVWAYNPNKVRAGDLPHFLGALDAGEGGEFFHVEAVGSAGCVGCRGWRTTPARAACPRGPGTRPGSSAYPRVRRQSPGIPRFG
jgi:hypothetical protein